MAQSPASPPGPVVRIERVCKDYKLGEETVHALKDISFTIDDGVFLAIAGPSGSGKSTMLNMIGCIDTPSAGRIVIDGTDVSGKRPDELADLRSRTISFVFQTFNLFPVLTARENVEYPMLRRGDINKSERKERVDFFLDTVGLTKYAGHRPNQLSGGQRQRVAIARALATRPRIVLADEPTANLDYKTGESILSMMKAINRAFETTFVFSTHDQRVMGMADRLVRIEDGEITTLGVRAGRVWKYVKEKDVPIPTSDAEMQELLREDPELRRMIMEDPDLRKALLDDQNAPAPVGKGS
ncbi:MAG: ATP-binding cassette domain-containing protein [Betaproteobacteria bacterium]|nr:ATP-binding cassette domain-containing protein [Betaproteobacteria bacterium]